MARSFFFASLLTLTLLLTACPADSGPTPCTGASCPAPSACATDPGLAKQTAAKGFTVSSSFKACYKSGAADKVSFDLKVDEAKIPTDRVIVVVDIVTEDSNKNTTSVARQFFGSASDISVSPDLFNNGTSKTELVAGINATIDFKFKSGSPVGDPYYLVISLFKGGGDTNNPKDLLGRIIYKFKTAQS
jgi:hypothetical protein